MKVQEETTNNYYIPLLLVIYFWFLVATPQQRFPFLGSLHLEKVIVFLLLALIATSGRISYVRSNITNFVIVWYLILLLSFVFSDYQDVYTAQHWIQSYWKTILIFFLLTWGLRSLDELKVLILGISFALLLYQLHSWFDYINGGSYVYQQGVKRIIGVWSGGGIGAANRFASLGLWSVPFGIFSYTITDNKKIKILSVSLIILSISSIIFSGTRGALVSLLAYMILIYGRKRKRYILGFLLILIMAIPYLPESLQHRYLDLVIPSEEVASSSRNDDIARKSADSRIEGLKDGWQLMLHRPVFGYGPGSSAFARKEVRPYGGEGFEDVMTLQLHSLYGQILGETGVIGSLFFFLIIIIVYSQIRTIHILNNGHSINKEYAIYITFIKSYLAVMIAYGVFSHTLYSFNWILLLGIHVVFVSIVKKILKDKDKDKFN